MMYNTSQCQEYFRNKFTGEDGTPFHAYRNGKGIKDKLLEAVDVKQYNLLLKEDIKGYYYKAVLSFAEGIAAVNRGNFTWATIKLYYSIFFGLRCSLLIRKVIMLRAQKNLYVVKLITGTKYENVTPSNDHSGSIKVYVNLFGRSDFLCGNHINGKNAYEWYEDCRNIVNYKDAQFYDPDISPFWFEIVEELRTKELKEVLNKLIDEKSIYCFLEGYAVLSVPLNRTITVSQELRNERIEVMSDEQKDWIKAFLTGSMDYETLKQILI